ncbi:MAG: hypothetical protein AAGG00_14690 [Cyanobacteria bacterium P01_H01_bin.150]
MELYNLAIASAKTYGFIQNEALANELAAKFWLGMNKEDFAPIYLRKAYKWCNIKGRLFCKNVYCV